MTIEIKKEIERLKNMNVSIIDAYFILGNVNKGKSKAGLFIEIVNTFTRN